MSALRQLGRGWGFPVKVDPVEGAPPVEEGPEKVRQAIRILLETEPGERVMRPTFGCGLRTYLAQPNAVATHALIERDVRIALAEWEPRIEATTVEVSPGEDPALVDVAISYVHVRTGRPDALVVTVALE